MKKKLSTLIILLLGSFMTITAQDLDAIMRDLGKIEGAVYQNLDKSMLGKQLKNDSTGVPKAKHLSFMDKINAIELVVLEDAPKGNAAFDNVINLKVGNDYETLVKIKDGNSDVNIVSRKKDDSDLDVYIIVKDDNNLIMVKMSGAFTSQDLTDIVNEQTKTKK